MGSRPTARARASAALFQASLVAALVGFGLYFDHTASLVAPVPETIARMQGELAREQASPQVARIARWAVDTQDHAGLPFVVVDKARARLFAFDPQGRLVGSAPVLLGTAKEDGAKAPATPAGRFVTDTWLSARSDGIVWVNETTAVSLHETPSPQSPGRGLQRLASREVEDKRISDGSLHVSGEFYRNVMSALRTQPGVAYVLPEVLPLEDVFRSDDAPWSRSHFAHSLRSPVGRGPS